MNKCLTMFLQGIALGFVLFPMMFYVYVISGAAPVKAAATPLPLEHFFAKSALHAQMDKEFPKVVPIAADFNTLRAGAVVYRDNCLVCHGGSAGPAAVIGKGMFPSAPQLLVGKDMITDDPPGETFWKAKNGIRLTGMPAFGSSLTDTELWEVSVMLGSADKLPANIIQVIDAEPKSIRDSK
jgi:mono/diheme cytochrome c family protein